MCMWMYISIHICILEVYIYISYRSKLRNKLDMKICVRKSSWCSNYSNDRKHNNNHEIVDTIIMIVYVYHWNSGHLYRENDVHFVLFSVHSCYVYPEINVHFYFQFCKYCPFVLNHIFVEIFCFSFFHFKNKRFFVGTMNQIYYIDMNSKE
jgi:hypothetical protein